MAAACTAEGQCTETAGSAVVENENMDFLEFGSTLPLQTESDLLSSEREQLACQCLWAAAVEAVGGGCGEDGSHFPRSLAALQCPALT